MYLTTSKYIKNNKIGTKQRTNQPKLYLIFKLEKKQIKFKETNLTKVKFKVKSKTKIFKIL